MGEEVFRMLVNAEGDFQDNKYKDGFSKDTWTKAIDGQSPFERKLLEISKKTECVQQTCQGGVWAPFRALQNAQPSDVDDRLKGTTSDDEDDNLVHWDQFVHMLESQ